MFCATAAARAVAEELSDAVRAGSALLSPLFAAATAALGWTIAEWIHNGGHKWSAGDHETGAETKRRLEKVARIAKELNEAIGGTTLYNEALGTTSDVYHYDRVKGRE